MTTDYLNKWSVIVAGKDDIQNGVVTDSRYWNVAGYSIGKVTRSKRNNSDELSIDIGALRALKDCVADIDGEVIKNYGNITKQEAVDKIRKACGMDKTPLLIIYRIDGNSKAQDNSQTRQDLNMGCDIIGLHICVPGDQINNKYCKRLTIQIPEKNIEDEVEENS